MAFQASVALVYLALLLFAWAAFGLWGMVIAAGLLFLIRLSPH